MKKPYINGLKKSKSDNLLRYIMPKWRKWNKKEMEILITCYPNVKKQKLMKVLNRTWSAIQRRASEFRIKRRIWEEKSNKIHLARKFLEQKYIHELRSQRKIAKGLGLSKRTIAKAMEEYGIKTRKKDESVHLAFRKNKLKLDGTFRDFLDGLLLGDGSLKANNWTALYEQKCVKKEWLQHIGKVFSRNGIVTKIKPHTEIINGKNYRLCVLRTLRYEELKKFYDRWYKNRQKVIPKDINLRSAQLLANWHMGDGSYSRDRVVFATNSFTKNDVMWLLGQLRRIYKFSSTVNKENEIRLDTESSRKFVKLIRPYILPCFYYKG